MIQIAYHRIQSKPFNWKKFSMAIEDPFEKTHNLAQGISEQSGAFFKFIVFRLKDLLHLCFIIPKD